MSFPPNPPGRLLLTKGTYQNRARGVAILARLDFGGAPHRNPDDEEITCPHLHLYREGYGDRSAVPLPAERFSDAGDPWVLLQSFEQARALLENGTFNDSEPGPYRILAVYSVAWRGGV